MKPWHLMQAGIMALMEAAAREEAARIVASHQVGRGKRDLLSLHQRTHDPRRQRDRSWKRRGPPVKGRAA